LTLAGYALSHRSFEDVLTRARCRPTDATRPSDVVSSTSPGAPSELLDRERHQPGGRDAQGSGLREDRLVGATGAARREGDAAGRIRLAGKGLRRRERFSRFSGHRVLPRFWGVKAAAVNGHVHPGLRFSPGKSQFGRRPDSERFVYSQAGSVRANSVGKTTQSVLASLGFIAPIVGGNSEVDDVLADSWAVYACLYQIADDVVRVPMRIHASEEEDSEPIPEESDVAKLFAKPSAFEAWDSFLQASVIHYKLTGENFVFLMDAGGGPAVPMQAALPSAQEQQSGGLAARNVPLPLPASMLPLHKTQVTPHPDQHGVIRSWSYNALGASLEVQEFPNESLLKFIRYDPRNVQRGISPIESAMRAIGIGFQAERYAESVNRSGGPGAYFLTGEPPPITEEAERFQDEVNEKNRDPNTVGGLKVVWGKDGTIVPNPATPKELMQGEQLAYARNVVCTVLGVPPPVIGIYDRAIYNNIAEAFRQYWSGIKGTLDAIAKVYNSDFFPRLKDPRARNFRMRFDYSEIAALREDNLERMKEAREIAKARIGVSYPEALKLVGVKAEVEIDEEFLGADPNALPDPDAAPNAKPPAKPAPDKSQANPKLSPPRHPALRERSQREGYLASLHARVAFNPERRAKAASKSWFTRYEKATRASIAHYAAHGTPKVDRAFDTEEELEQLLMLSTDKWVASLETAMQAPLEAAYLAALSDVAIELAVPQIEMSSPAIIEFLAKQRVFLAEGVTSTLESRVRAALVESMLEARTTGTLQEKLVEVLPALDDRLSRVFANKEGRALTIARTEVGKAVSDARIRQMLEAGVTKIQWLSWRDEAVRDSHRELDGQIRAIGQEFKARLRWPRDQEGEAAEVINCRCQPLPVDESEA
jgi:SPP1 gp7 family putative phage head morphogenesis protein